MEAPIPSFNQAQISGKVSWFGGPHDPSDGGHTASGGTTREPGIAVYNRSTLGGYWRVTAPNGRSAVLRQTDLGPAPWTGRKVDVTYSALGQLGYNEGNFPTDKEVKATYLGKNRPKEGVTNQAQPVRQQAIANVTEPGREVTQFNQQGYQQALQHAAGERAAASLFAGEGGAGGLLGSVLQQAGRNPNPSQFASMVKLGGGPVAVPGSSNQTQPGTNAAPTALGGLGGFLPRGASYHLMRTDQGKDVQLNPGQALLATGHYEVLAVPSDPAGFGPAYPVVRFTSGPDAGHDIYLGHTDSAVHVGQKGNPGDVLAHTSRTGHNAPPGWVEIGLWGANGPLAHGEAGETKAGKEAARLIGAG